MAVLGVILLIVGICVGGFGLYSFFSSASRLEQLTSAGKEKIGEILSVMKETKATLSGIGDDDGAMKKDITIMGKADCSEPLTSPIGNVKCLYYKYNVTATETYYENVTDSNGNHRRERRTRTNTLDSGSSCVQSFKLDDGTGSVIVEPQDAEYEGLIKSADKSETKFNNNNMSMGSISIGGLSINLGSNSSMFNNGSNEPTVVKYTEEIIGLDRNLTVIGTLCDTMGEFRIRNEGKSKLLISTKSSELMLAEAKTGKKTGKMCSIGGGIATVIGILLLLI